MELFKRNPGAKSVTADMEVITPKEAAKYLGNNLGSQRLVNSRNVERIKRAILDDRWVVNGETIVFSKEDKLLNGQHRLHACIAANKSIQTIVVKGVDKDVFETIDIGKSRCAADLLKIQGFTSCASIAGASRLVLTYKRYNDSQRSLCAADAIPPVDAHDILHECMEHPQYEHITHSVFSRYKRATNILTPATSIFFYNLFTEIDDEARELFFTCMADGAPTKRKNCPFLEFRENMIEYRIKSDGMRSRLTNYFIIGSGLRAWNLYMGVEQSKFTEKKPLPMIANNPWRI